MWEIFKLLEMSIRLTVWACFATVHMFFLLWKTLPYFVAGLLMVLRGAVLLLLLVGTGVSFLSTFWRQRHRRAYKPRRAA